MSYKPYRQRINGGGKPYSIANRQRTNTQSVPQEWLAGPRVVERTHFKSGLVILITVSQASYELQNSWYPVRGDWRALDEILSDILSSGASLCSLQASYVLVKEPKQPEGPRKLRDEIREWTYEYDQPEAA
jgi:hypothetical protein